MNKKGLSIGVIIFVILFIGCIVAFIVYKVNVNNKINQSIHDLCEMNINDFQEKHTQGDFPDEMKDFLSTSTVDLFEYCFSHPNDFRDKQRLYKHYEGVLLYKNVDLSRYKKVLLPKIKKLVGKYTKPECFENNSKTAQQGSLPYSPDLKQFQNTLIEWCLIANCFEEKDDGNSAFLLSYGAARLSIKLLTDYADGASEENLRTVNNILRCASCQLIYIANSGLKHNSKMVRAMAKDLYTISEEYSPLSRTVNYQLNIFDTLFQKLSKEGNNALTNLVGNNGDKKLSQELKKLFLSFLDFCDLPYSESCSQIVKWDNDLRTKADEGIKKSDRSNLPKLAVYALIKKNLSDYNNLKLSTDETRVIMDGAATILSTYEFIDNSTGSFTYSPSIIAKYSGSSIPDNRLSGVPIEILLPGTILSTSSKDPGVVYCKDHEIFIKSNKFGLMRTEEKKNNFGIVFLTKNEYVLRMLKQEYKSDYFDIDEVLSKMTPEQRANYEKANIENEKKKQEAEKKANESVAKVRSERVKIDSIDDFACGYKFGEKARNVKESNYIQFGGFGITFCVESKKPFLGEFKLATVFVDKDKKVEMVNYGKSYNTTSERETCFMRIKNAIEAMEGIKFVKHTEDNKKEEYDFLGEKDNCKIILSLSKGLDGGGTISLDVTK